MIDWSKPIEWSDGTPARVNPRFNPGNTTGGWYGVNGDKCPKGMSPRDCGLLNHPENALVVNAITGHVHGNRTDIFIRNVEMTTTPVSIARDSTDRTNRTKEGEYRSFTLKRGTIYDGKTVLLQWFDDRVALVPLKAVQKLNTAEKIEDFHQLIADIKSFNGEVRYVDSVEGFMNPKARFDDFMAGRGSSGLELSETQMSLPSLYSEVQDVFTKAFTPPPPPPPVYVRAANKPSERTRLRVNGNSVGNSSYSINLKQAKVLFLKAYKYWLKNPPKSRVPGLGIGTTVASGYSRSVRVSPAAIRIGCQNISRAQVEELADRQGWWPTVTAKKEG